jgi:hypothetical protein
MRRTFCAAVAVTIASLSGLNAAEVRLGAEMPLGPAPQFTPAVAQSNVQIAYASSHMLAVWTTEKTMFGALDGAPVAFSVSNPFDLAILGVAGGRNNFLVVFRAYSPANSLFALRVGFDGRVLDPDPIVVPIGANQNALDGGVAYDGSEFVTVNLRKRQGLSSVIPPPEFVTASISDDGVARSGAVFKFPSSQPSVPLQPRIAWTGTRFVAGYGVRTYTYDAPWGISAVPFEHDAANDLTLGQTAFPDLRGREGVIRMAVAANRATFVWLVLGTDAAIKVAQTDLDGKPVSAPKAFAVPTPGLSNPQDGDIRIAWDGTEYLVSWIAAGLGAPGKIQGIRLRYDATPIDAQPFDIAADSVTTSLSLTTTAYGFAIAYSRADLTNGGKPRAFVRALERLPAPRRRAVGR